MIKKSFIVQYKTGGLDLDEILFLRSISLKRDQMEECSNYPFNIPAISSLNTLKFESPVTFFVGENGSGKSTLLEAIALALGFNPEGGSKNYNFITRDSHSSLFDCIKLNKSYLQPKDGFFLRAESYYNLATHVDDLDSVPMNSPLITNAFGGKSLHSQSHGESFLSLLINRLWGNGIYLLDEPEAALSPSRQMTALSRIHELVKLSSQFIIATHSPIIMAYPHAAIYHLDEDGMERIPYEETEHYQITKYFMNNREKMLRELL